jgi:integrase
MEVRMPVLTLTPAVIATGLKCLPGQGHTEYCDAKVRGLFADIASSPAAKPTWNYRFREKDGKLKSHRLGLVEEITLDDARKQVTLLKAERAVGRHVAKQEEALGITLDRFWNDNYIPHVDGVKRSVLRDRQLYKRISPQFGHLPMKQITRLQVEQFKRALSAEGLSPATVNHHLQLMRRLLNLALEWEILERNVLQRFKLLRLDNTREAYLTDAQVESLVKVLQTDENRLVCMVILFLLSTGARLREGLSVEWGHLDLENGIWKIPAKNSKSKSTKHLPLNSSALWAIKAMPKKDDSPFVFASPVTGKALSGITRTWYKLRRKAGLPSNFRIHDLRHSYASRLVSAGESLYVVQQLLGHADPRTTMRYAHLNMETQQRAANLAAVPLG